MIERPFRPGGVREARLLSAAAWLICLVTLHLIALIDTEAVMVTGPAIFGCGMLLVYFGLRSDYQAAAWLGAAHMGTCVLFTALVNVFRWGPGEAKWPFIWMGLIYVASSLPWTLWVRSHAPRSHPYECSTCGYLLYGLREPRCPECGAVFDAALLADPKP